MKQWNRQGLAAGMKLLDVQAQRWLWLQSDNGCGCNAVMVVAAVWRWLWLQCGDGWGCSAAMVVAAVQRWLWLQCRDGCDCSALMVLLQCGNGCGCSPLTESVPNSPGTSTISADTSSHILTGVASLISIITDLLNGSPSSPPP